jgi:cyclopropane fatty-acyl-phospholipid synthase-like methyltransferase
VLKVVGDRLEDGRWYTPSADRNKGPILAVLERFLPQTGVVLEIGSGTGQHVAHFAAAFPGLTWQPTDMDADFRESIQRWITAELLRNVRAPVELDVLRRPWPVAQADAVVSINMIHVAPWAATAALLEGASAVLPDGGVLFLYGPYRRFGGHTAPSNAAFDAQLRGQDPEWGLRDLEAVVELAGATGLEVAETNEMPANNFSIIFRKRSTAHR